MSVIENGLNQVAGIFKEKPIAASVGAAGAGLALGVGAAAVVGAVKSKSSKKRKARSSRQRGRRIKHTKRGWAQDRKRRSKQKWEVAYKKRKRKNRSSSRRGKVYYARKTGQPYIILSSGKAKFIKGKRRAR